MTPEKQSQDPNINWYPGHMKKAVRMMEDSLKLVDAVIEVRDARVPRSSSNPDVKKLIGSKPRLIVLNRIDQADPNYTAIWRRYLQEDGSRVLETDCQSGKGVNNFQVCARELLADLIERNESKGQSGKALRFMVLGIPNVGKSSFINRLAGRKVALAGDKPGVTRGKQWINVGTNFQLLDTPGILWPKLDSADTGLSLAWTGAIKDDILDVELIACRLLEFLKNNYPGALEERYKVIAEENEDGYDLLQKIARKRGFLVSGGDVNTERMSRVLLDEYRAGKLGRLTLERP